jgi:hypothetical protein
MLKFLTHVALSHEVTSIALLLSQESHKPSLPLPATHGITLELAADTLGVKTTKAVTKATSEQVASTMVAVATSTKVWVRMVESEDVDQNYKLFW